jgi:hypothetical protein
MRLPHTNPLPAGAFKERNSKKQLLYMRKEDMACSTGISRGQASGIRFPAASSRRRNMRQFPQKSGNSAYLRGSKASRIAK